MATLHNGAHNKVESRIWSHLAATAVLVLAPTLGLTGMAQAQNAQPKTSSSATNAPTSGSKKSPLVPAHVQIFEGTGQFVEPAKAVQDRRPAGGDISLDFSNADIHDVVRSVMGDILHLPFTISEQVKGEMTLKTGAPISRKALLPALEAALEVDDVALLQQNGTYEIVPMSDAQKHASRLVTTKDAVADAGFGVEIVPLHYIAAGEMKNILLPMTPQGAQVRADRDRDLLFLTGTEPQRTSLSDTIAMFDVDYFQSMSFALIQPVHVDSGTLASELEKIFDNTNSPVAGLVKLIPISRINSLLVATPRASYLHEVNRWVRRLDIPSTGPGRHLYYYRLQNSRAQDVSTTLAQLFGGNVSTYSQSAHDTAPQPSFGSPSQASAMGFQDNHQFTSSPQPVQHRATSTEPVFERQTTGAGGEDSDVPKIVMDEANNALIIRTDQATYKSIVQVIKKMDVAPNQVLIEATIAEITLNKQMKYGIEWGFKKRGTQSYTLSSDGSVKTSFPGFALSYVVPNVQIALSALGAKTKVSVLSSPKILTLDNHSASLEVGDQVPVATQTSMNVTAAGAPVVSTISMKNTGVILSVTPRISKSGMVFLDVSQEVSDVVPTTTSGIDSPTIQQRKLQSTVGVMDGQTIALGGLIRQASSSGDSGVPILKDIPLLGHLLRSDSHNHDRTELLIFLTPHVIRDPEAAQAITDQLTHALHAVKRMVDDLQPLTPTQTQSNRNAAKARSIPNRGG